MSQHLLETIRSCNKNIVMDKEEGRLERTAASRKVPKKGKIESLNCIIRAGQVKGREVGIANPMGANPKTKTGKKL